jgi:hypothetical protein
MPKLGVVSVLDGRVLLALAGGVVASLWQVGFLVHVAVHAHVNAFRMTALAATNLCHLHRAKLSILVGFWKVGARPELQGTERARAGKNVSRRWASTLGERKYRK